METPEIHSAAQSGNCEKLKILLEEDPQLVNAEDWRGQKPLHYAAENSRKCVEFLIKNGADVNERDRNGYTAIFGACTVEIAKVLMENGANINIVGWHASTPLSRAIHRQNYALVSYLISQGANINQIQKLDFRETMTQATLSTLRHKDSPERLIERLLKIGFVDRSEFKPCTETEIVDLENRNKVQLPESYKKFLRIMGNGAGWFLKSDHWEVFYPDFNECDEDNEYKWLGVDFFKIPEADLHEYTQKDRDLSANVPNNFFVFATRSGYYPLGFFADGIDKDPDVYTTDDDESGLKLWGKSFWKFFQEMVEYYEYICDRNKHSKTAVPWSANYTSDRNKLK